MYLTIELMLKPLRSNMCRVIFTSCPLYVFTKYIQIKNNISPANPRQKKKLDFILDSCLTSNWTGFHFPIYLKSYLRLTNTVNVNLA